MRPIRIDKIEQPPKNSIATLPPPPPQKTTTAKESRNSQLRINHDTSVPPAFNTSGFKSSTDIVSTFYWILFYFTFLHVLPYVFI